MQSLEIADAREQRRANPTKVPKRDYQSVVDIVGAAWKNVNHERVAEIGYKQTGPTMPLDGPIAEENVFRDLLPIWQKLRGDLIGKNTFSLLRSVSLFVRHPKVASL